MRNGDTMASLSFAALKEKSQEWERLDMLISLRSTLHGDCEFDMFRTTRPATRAKLVLSKQLPV